MLLTNAAPQGDRKPSAHSLHHCKPEGATPRGRPPPPPPSQEPVVAGRRGLWQTPFRARHGQLLLRSPGSGVRHRWLSNRRNRRPGPEEPGAFLVPGVRRPPSTEHRRIPSMSTLTAAAALADASPTDAAERIGELRTEIDACD